MMVHCEKIDHNKTIKTCRMCLLTSTPVYYCPTTSVSGHLDICHYLCQSGVNRIVNWLRLIIFSKKMLKCTLTWHWASGRISFRTNETKLGSQTINSQNLKHSKTGRLSLLGNMGGFNMVWAALLYPKQGYLNLWHSGEKCAGFCWKL